MSLNKSRGNMYSWVSHTWSPVRGCEFDCKYCYVKSMRGYSTEPRIVEKELTFSLGENKTIFVCSMADLFGGWVQRAWIELVLQHCKDYPKNTYLFQSKNPRRFLDFIDLFPEQTILGTTIETNRDFTLISKAPRKVSRSVAMREIQSFKKEITIEPIMMFDLDEMVNLIEKAKPNFVAIGADSKGHNLPEPTSDEISQLISELKKFTDVKIKKNLYRIWDEVKE